MTDVRSRIAALSPQQREQLERRLADLTAARGVAGVERIEPRDRSRPAPLGIAQQREWAIERFRGANNIVGAIRIVGGFDLELFGAVLTDVVERHEVLRSTVELQADGTPAQVVQPVTAVEAPVVDLSDLPPDEQGPEVKRHGLLESQRPFDPAQPNRLRVVVLRLAADTHVVLLTTDHAASDAWSWSILADALVTSYLARRDGAAGAPPLEIQFADFAAWQRAKFDPERITAEVRHWQETLAGIPAGAALPTDRPVPARPTYAGAFLNSDLSQDLADGVRRLCESEHASLFAVLLAASSVLMNRYLEQDDLVIGSLVSGRTRAESERLIGCFANPLPLRMQFSGDRTMRELVHQARDVLATALDHQDLPFDRLIEALGLGAEAAQTSLSRLWINVLTVPDSVMEVSGLRITTEPVDLGLASIDLTVTAIPLGDTLRLQWQYMAELFDHATVQVFADQFQTVLSQLVADPDRTVRRVRLAAAAEERPAIGVLPDGVAEPGFVELFQRRVAVAPYAPAVVYDGAATSYRELNRQANRLAHHLRGLGVGPETPVGILLGRSPRLAWAILGVLKAGGVYLPLDPSYPPGRIASMLEDAGVRVLLTEESLAGLASEAIPPEGIVVLDGATPLPGGAQAESDPIPLPSPTSAAYIVYTSGSTGRPKGTVIEHRSLVRFAREVADRLGLGTGDRFLQFASPGFDVLVEELFPIWLAGGAVVITAGHIISGQVDLVDLVARERISVMELPTAYWHEWTRGLDRAGRELPECLRLVLIGGERVLPERLAMWRRTGVPLINDYGLTETTCTSTFFRLDPADPAWDWPNLPIGTPIPLAELRILDSQLEPAPTGGVGELYIGGLSLARGYLGRPGLTAHRFVADPDPARPGQRLYRTGDLVRRRADGNFEFVSRVDAQVKIRGFRVEPAEIESALSRHPDVAECVVALYEPVPGDRRLAGYVVPRAGAALAVAELRRYLEELLPPYMVPAAFVQLDALPLNANGKVDRPRLPAPQDGRMESAEQYAAPTTPLQRKLADIVAAVVGVDRVGIHDNFFEIGGDSIQAIQVVARTQEEGLRLEPYDLFANPTVAQLAEIAGAGPAIDADQGEVSGPLPVTAMQKWFATAGIANPSHWNRSALLDPGFAVDPERMRTAVERLMRHHDGLRQRVLLAGERTRARIAPGGDATPFEVHDLTGRDTGEQDRELTLIAERMQAGLNPSVGPLARFALIRLGERGDRIAVVVHRLAADAVSMDILLQDLHTLLTADGAAAPLPAKTTSWQSWSRRLAAYAKTEDVQSQREYWTALVGSPAAEIPLDGPDGREDDTAADGRTLTVALDPTQTGDLLGAAPGALDSSVDELLLTALSRALGAWTGGSRHVVDLERHDRARLFADVDLTRTAGWFSRTHPLALVCDPGSSPRATLGAVRRELQGVPAGGVGWQLLRQDPDAVPAAPSDLVFGYRDRSGSTGFASAARPLAGDTHPDGRRPYALAVDASVDGDSLTIRWEYSERLHREQTVRDLADRFLAELRALIELAGAPRDESGPEPADFPLARVDGAQLADLLGRL